MLKNRNTGEVYFLVVFTLLFGENLEAVLKDEKVRSGQSSVSESPRESQSSPDSIRLHPNISVEKDQPQPTSTNDARVVVDSQQTNQLNTSGPAGYLASSLYSALSSLGFGRQLSDSSSSSESNIPDEISAREQPNNWNRWVDNVEDSTVEDYPRSKHESK